MSQSTFGDDDLFDEAADDIRTDVEASLDAASAKLPKSDAIWAVESDNTLGVLNALRSAFDVGDATEDLRDAKKWYTIGNRADVFEDADDLEARIETLDDVIGEVEEAHDHVSALASTVPELRDTLDDLGDVDSAVDEAEATGVDGDTETNEVDAETAE